MEATFDRTPYQELKSAVNALAGVCDGALADDDQGFDGADTRAGHLYAFLPFAAWPLSVLHRAWQWTRKYHRQLELMQIDYMAIPEPPHFEGETRQIASDPDDHGWIVVFPNDDHTLSEAFRRLPGSREHTVPIGESGKLFFRYRTYHGPRHLLLAFARQHQFRFDPTLQAEESPNRVVYEQRSDSFALYFPDRALNAEVKTIPCRSHSFDGGFHWVIAARSSSARPLRTFLSTHGFPLPADVAKRLDELETGTSCAGASTVRLPVADRHTSQHPTTLHIFS